MFADSLLENHWTDNGRRGWTTLASFALQTFAIAILLTGVLGYRALPVSALPQDDSFAVLAVLARARFVHKLRQVVHGADGRIKGCLDDHREDVVTRRAVLD